MNEKINKELVAANTFYAFNEQINCTLRKLDPINEKKNINKIKTRKYNTTKTVSQAVYR